MTTILAPVACTYSTGGVDTTSIADSPTTSCDSGICTRIESFSALSVAVAASSHDATETLFIKNLEVAARCKAEFSLEKEPQPFQAASAESEFMIDKKDELFRRDYIDRLTMMKIIRPQSHKSHQTLAIFDWDDTLLPTSFLYYAGLETIRSNPQMQAVMSKLDKNVAKILEKAARVAKTYIVTNAMKDWVETSSEMYLPLTYQVIKSKEIMIVSARHEYEEIHPENPKQWKLNAFLKLGEVFEAEITTNIICMGDNEIEMDAAQALGRKFHQSMVKTVKFKQQPRPEELIKQHELVLHKFDQIYTTLKSLGIKLEKKN